MRILLALLIAALLAGCARDRAHVAIISIPDQQMLLLKKGTPIARYPVSTSKFGLGDIPGSKATPLGSMEIVSKFGKGAPVGTVFKSRRRTGEIVGIDSPGRDPIVTRILWLKGLEHRNERAYGRHIYIHGTPEERSIGTPASYGCVRMRSRDVVSLFDTIGVGARVEIINAPLPEFGG